MSRAFPSTPEAASAVRQFLREATDGQLSRESLADALLLTTELVTNAVRHAGTPHEPVEVAVDLDDGALRIAVRDHGPGFDPTEDHVRTEDGGWGLDLVKMVARGWGVEAAPGATQVWFELDARA